MWNQGTRIRNPKVVGDEVNNSLMKGDKITRRSKGKGKGEIKEYDHRNSPEFDQYDVKKIMKGEHGFYNYKN